MGSYGYVILFLALSRFVVESSMLVCSETEIPNKNFSRNCAMPFSKQQPLV